MLLLLLAPSPARANAHAVEDIPLEDLLQPVVAASRYEQRQQDAPAAVSVVSEEAIRSHGYRSLGEVLRSLRGVYTVDDRSYTYLGLRGFGIPGDYNTRVLLLLDGLRLNNNIYDTAYMGQDLPIDVNLIKRVELVRGPSSSVYGSNAFLGVINIVTLRGADLRGARATFGIGSLGTTEGSVAYGNLFGDRLDVLLTASFINSHGNEVLNYKEFAAPETRYGYVRGQDAEQVGRVMGQVSLAGATLRAAYATRQKEIPTASFGTVFAAPQLHYVDSHGFIDLRYSRTFADDLALLAHASYNVYWFEGDYPYDYGEPGDPPLLTLNRDTALGSWWNAHLQLSKTFLGRYKLLAGAELNDSFHQEQENFDIAPREVYLDRTDSTRALGAYLQAELRFLRRLTLNVGLRYDHYVGSFGGSLSPRGALLVQLFSETHLKALAGTAFRAPSAYERFYVFGEPGSGTAQLFNPNLAPERIQTYELLLEQQLGRSSRVQLGGYYYQIRDLIRLAQNASGDVSFQNLDQSHALGLELEGEVRWRGINARASYSLQRSWSSDTKRDLANSPRHLGKLNLLVPLSTDKLLLGLEAQAISARANHRGHQVSPTLLANATLVYQELLPGLTVRTSVKNLFDARYSDPGSIDHVQEAISQDGRTFWLTLSYHRGHSGSTR